MNAESLEAVEIRDILRLLPHRYPFVMVDRIIDIRGDESGIGIKNVTINEPQFLGHFPENPVMPGVLVIEGMAQTAAVLVLRHLAIARGAIDVPHHHRQGKVPQAGRARRQAGISRSQVGEPPLHVVVSDRGQGRQHRRRRGAELGAMIGEARIVIDPTARVAEGARIGEGVEIGPYCIVGPQRRARRRRAVDRACSRHRRHHDRRGHRRVSVCVAGNAATIGALPRRSNAACRWAALRVARRRHHEHGHRGWRRADQHWRAVFVHGRLPCRS